MEVGDRGEILNPPKEFRHLLITLTVQRGISALLC